MKYVLINVTFVKRTIVTWKMKILLQINSIWKQYDFFQQQIQFLPIVSLKYYFFVLSLLTQFISNLDILLSNFLHSFLANYNSAFISLLIFYHKQVIGFMGCISSFSRYVQNIIRDFQIFYKKWYFMLEEIFRSCWYIFKTYLDAPFENCLSHYMF